MTVTNLVSVQPAHASLNLRSIYTFDIVAFFVLDKYASKESHHVGAVQKNIRFFKRHALVQCTGEMVDPHSVLSTHVLFLAILFLFASKEQALCEKCQLLAINNKDNDTY